MTITTPQKDFLLSFLFGAFIILPFILLIGRLTNPGGFPDGGLPGFMVIVFSSFVGVALLGQKVSANRLLKIMGGVALGFMCCFILVILAP